MRVKFCPKCGADITDFYQEADPDGGYYCEACDEMVEADDDEED